LLRERAAQPWRGKGRRKSRRNQEAGGPENMPVGAAPLVVRLTFSFRLDHAAVLHFFEAVSTPALRKIRSDTGCLSQAIKAVWVALLSIWMTWERATMVVPEYGKNKDYKPLRHDQRGGLTEFSQGWTRNIGHELTCCK